jgi:hypothetical protein
MYTGMARRVPKGEVPPTRYPLWRLATSGLQGSTDLAPIWRARFLVDTLRLPCISTSRGLASWSCITSVLTTA